MNQTNEKFMSLCKNLLDDLQHEKRGSVKKSIAFIMKYKIQGGNKNLRTNEAINVLQSFIDGKTTCTVKYVEDEEKKIVITQELYDSYFELIPDIIDKISDYYNGDANKRSKELAIGIDKISEERRVLKEIFYNNIPKTSVTIFLEFLKKMFDDKFMICGYVDNITMLKVVCEHLHEYNISKKSLDLRIKKCIENGKQICKLCEEGGNREKESKEKKKEIHVKKESKVKKEIPIIIEESDDELEECKNISIETNNTEECKNTLGEDLDNSDTEDEIDISHYFHDNNFLIPSYVTHKIKKLINTDKSQFDKIMDKITELTNHLFPTSNKYIKNIDEIYEGLRFLTTMKNGKLNSNTIGVGFLNYFFMDDMILTKKSGRNIFDSWNDTINRKKLIESTFKNKDLTIFSPLAVIRKYSYQGSRAYNFPPNIAKYMYNKYGGKQGRVLDFCAGFGGRLLGFWHSNASEYIGIDPNKNLKHNEMISWLRANDFHNKKKVEIIYSPAEDVNFKELGEFDLVFTSPPYFDSEIYSEDESQSVSKYPKYNEWLEKFLFTTIDKTINVLKNNGVLAINIKTVKDGKNKYDIPNDMISYVSKYNYMSRMEDIEFVQSNKNKLTDKHETIYCWKKMEILSESESIISTSETEICENCDEFYDINETKWQNRKICKICLEKNLIDINDCEKIPNRGVCKDYKCKKCYFLSFASNYKRIVCWIKTRDGVNPRERKHGSTEILPFKCDKCFHKFDLELRTITDKNRWCAFCANQRLCDDECVICFEKSFASVLNSQFCESIDGDFTPRQVPKRTEKNAWFKCDKCQHRFQMQVGNVTLGHWCQYCANKILCHKDIDCNICFNKSLASTEKSEYLSITKNTKIAREIFKNSGEQYTFDCPDCKCEFLMNPNSINGQNNQWCPTCKNKTEKKLYMVLSKLYKVITQMKIPGCKNIKSLHFDFCIQDKMIIIELDGRQHFIRIDRFNNSVDENILRDVYKMKCALDAGYSIIRISQVDVWNNKYNWEKKLVDLISQFPSKTPVVIYESLDETLYDRHKQGMKEIYEEL